MPSLGPVANLKGAVGAAYTPLLLAAFTFQGTGTQLLLSTHPISTVEGGPSFPGIGALPAGNYAGRIAEEDIEAIQYRSRLGVDRVPRVNLHIFDQDRFIYTNYVPFGFRGATLVLAIVMWQPGTTNFSSDAPVVFSGTCDMETTQDGGNVIAVNANTSHNTTTINLPNSPCENRCSNPFPITAAERTLAKGRNSIFSKCGYSADVSGGKGNIATTGGPTSNGRNVVNAYGDAITDNNGVYILCDFIRSNPNDPNAGCMARMGNAAGTTFAPDGDIHHDKSGRRTGNFTGIQWNPSTFYAYGLNYVAGTKIPIFSFLNAAILGGFIPIIYGTQWVDGKVVNIVESGNDTKCEVICCEGEVGEGAIQQVVVQGVNLTQGGGSFITSDKNEFWQFAYDSSGVAVTGGPNGAPLIDVVGYDDRKTHYRALGDPFGNICRILAVFYKDVFTGFGTPQIRVLLSGPHVKVYVPILSAIGNGSRIQITWAGNYVNDDCAGNPPYTVTIVGNSWATANGDWNLTNWAPGPPGTVDLASSAFSGSGTGGYIVYDSGFAGGFTNNSNPVWVVIDILKRCNWDISEISITKAIATARYCFTSLSYIDKTGNSASHPRFMCEMAITDRKSAAEILDGVLRSFGGYLSYDDTGLLEINIETTLADQQPSPIAGSNYNTPIPSITYDGVTSGIFGYAAYHFDETNILRVKKGNNIVADLNSEDSTTSQTPNQITVSFQDRENGFVSDYLTNVDPHSVARSGGALNPGGSVVPESLSSYGFSNFDQAFRVTNSYIAKLQYGNEYGDARGTRTYTFTTSVRCQGLRTGQIVIFSWVAFNLVRQKFRVIKVQPMKDFHQAKVTIQWHEDIWFTAAYGQAPAAFYSNAGSNKPAKRPNIWQPNYTISYSFNNSEYTFGLTEIDTVNSDGKVSVQMKLTGYLPVNQIPSAIQPPLVPSQGTSANAGGSIIGGQAVIVRFTAVDTNGYESAMSMPVAVTIPSGTNTNTVTVSGIYWPTGTLSGNVYIGIDDCSVTFIQAIGFPGSSITVSGNINGILHFAPPDLASAGAFIQVKRVWHAGCLGALVAAVTPTTVTLGGFVGGTFTTNLAGRYLMCNGRQGSPVPLQMTQITSNTTGGTNTVLTVPSDATTEFQPLDSIVVSMHANISSTNTIGDTLFPNAYNGGIGFTSADLGRVVRIIFNTGRYQSRTINSIISSTTVGVATPWNTIPDSTSIFIVEDATWQYSSDVTPFQCDKQGQIGSFSINCDNISGSTVLVQALMTDASGSVFANQMRSLFRIGYVYGSAGIASRVNDGYYTITPVSGHATIDLANGLNQRLVLNGTAVTIDAIIFTGGTIVQGSYLTLYLDQDATSNRALPTFASGAGGFASNIGVNIPMSGTASTRTSIGLTFHGSIWGLDGQPSTGISIS